jgi:hypothetical protein
MPNQSYINGSVTVTTSPTLVCTVAAENDDVLVSCSAATVFGGPGVTATTGVSISANTPTHIPSTGGYVHDLYAIVSSSTSTVTYLYPSVG